MVVSLVAVLVGCGGGEEAWVEDDFCAAVVAWSDASDDAFPSGSAAIAAVLGDESKQAPLIDHLLGLNELVAGRLHATFPDEYSEEDERALKAELADGVTAVELAFDSESVDAITVAIESWTDTALPALRIYSDAGWCEGYTG